ncbi:MAG: TonB-dependent receptor [Gammaproteobacteria bacterium]|nr:TonB-dependent receptor [Gammaproteobacteria bacterium]MYK47980.1 TonB-dependent receptor [Gammaproteobacteria bacterium]
MGKDTREPMCRPWLGLVATPLAAAMIGVPASGAEEDAEDESDSRLEEVIVTATYRDTNLMDTPISITALSEDQIIEKGIHNIFSLYTNIPGLNLKKATSGFNDVTIRGISPYAEGNGSPVGAYLNNMPIGSTNGDAQHFSIPLFDLERVEVLKGPQGTLYGEGTMGGAIRYITNKPNPTGLDFAIRGSTETMAHSSGFGHRIDGMVNVPLGDMAAVRAILYSRDMKGLIDAPGRGEDTDWEEETGGRITVGFYPTDTFEAHAMYMDVDMTGGGPAIAFHCYEELRVDVNLIEIPSYPNQFDCSGDHNAQFDRDPYITHKAHPTLAGTDLDGTIDEYELFNLDFTWDLPFATLTGNYSTYDRYTKRAGDESPPHVNFSRRFVEDFVCFGLLPTGECDVSTAPTINPMTGRGGIMAGQICHSTCISWADGYSYEFRLVSNTDSRLKWTIGHYFKDSYRFDGTHAPCPDEVPYAGILQTEVDGQLFDEHCSLLWLFNPGITPERQATIVRGFLNRILFSGSRDENYLEETSYFGEVSYAITPQWEVTVGVRVADVQVQVDDYVNGFNPSNTIDTSFRLDDDTKTSPKVGLTWRPNDDWMVYGVWSHGFRPGIVQGAVVNVIAQVEPIRGSSQAAADLYDFLLGVQTIEGDQAESLELGVKATVADGRFSFTAALFAIDWTDIIIDVESFTPDLPGVSPFPFSYADNAGNAETRGVEFELEAHLSDALTLRAAGAWLPTADIGTASAGNDARVAGSTALGVQVGNRIPASPEFTGSVSLSYNFEIAGFQATARGEHYVVGEQWRGPDNERVTPSYHKTDTRLMLRRDNYDLAVYLNNAFDQVVAYERNQQGYNFGRARTFGVEVNWRM